MAQTDNTHSRVVIWLKIVLPLIALAMLSSIFLVSRSIDPTANLPFSEVDVAARAREPRLTSPTFSGMTSDGGLVTIHAADMRPDLADPSSGSGTDLTARLDTPDGASTTLAAAAGRVDTQAGTYAMTGGVTITTSAGYRITAPRMTGTLDATGLDASGSVAADAPMGRITAETMQIRPDPAAPGQYLLVFNDRVRLVYTP